MQYIADLHIHSPFSRATSKSSNLTGLAAWSALKGIDVIGTGDFTHPGWFRQLRENLQPAEPGFFKLKKGNFPKVLETDISERAASCRFVLTAEISSIYKKQGRVRKIHNIIFVPDLEAAARINTRLASLGNIESDGRPILGLDARDLLEIVLELAPEGFLVPAHIWTPWFSLFGSKSGFDAIDECFDDLSRYVFALETGLSSDPDMNRLVSALDRFTLISNSDCHSPSKLGREANIFTCGFNYFSMRDALKNPAVGGFQGTVEFFPEEGKYHHDGHRKCSINLTPQESRKLGNICPVCGKPLTIGVMHRVMELADRESPYYPSGSPRYYSLIPLAEVLGEILAKGPQTKTVQQEYGKLVRMFDSEFNLLLNVPEAEIRERYSAVLAEAVKRIRRGRVIRTAGFDGEFGVIRVFDQGERQRLVGQYSLFKKGKPASENTPVTKPSLLEFGAVRKNRESKTFAKSLNEEQLRAVTSDARHIVVTAGPGTGKTFTLVARIVRLLQENMARESEIAAITFTNRAAEEMLDRLRLKTGVEAERIFIGTFHAFCLQMLRSKSPELAVVSEEQRDRIIKKLYPGISAEKLRELIQNLQIYYRDLALGAGKPVGPAVANSKVQTYLDELDRRTGVDLNGVIPQVVHYLKTDKDLSSKSFSELKYLFIDEFQDLNRGQYELVRLLARKSSVFAIGDPDQAIYGFRGSSPEFFHLFIEEFGADTIPLVRNYRSAGKILEAARAVIRHNHSDKTNHNTRLIPENQNQSGVIEFFQAASPQAEAEFVVQRIEEFMGGISHFSIDSGRQGQGRPTEDRSFRDFAILYRLSRQAEFLTEALERRGIPFQVVNVRPFYMKKEIKPLYYWIRAAAESGREKVETAIYLQLLQTFPGVGRNSLLMLENQLPLGECPDFFDRVQALDLPKSVPHIVNAIRLNLLDFRHQVEQQGLFTATGSVTGFLRINTQTANAQRFLDLAGSFGSDLQQFAAYLKTNENGTVYDEKAEAVTLATVHGAKGLEFPVVFITGLEDGLFPHDYEPTDAGAGDQVNIRSASLAEERRLFYVGLTRSRTQLVLTSAATRPIMGTYRKNRVSPFIAEIPETLYEKTVRDKPRKKKMSGRQMKLF